MLDEEVRSLEGSEKEGKAYQQKVEGLRRERERLRRQVGRLASMRRLLSIWHMLHIPLGMALFTAAFIHIGAAIYYATLLK